MCIFVVGHGPNCQRRLTDGSNGFSNQHLNPRHRRRCALTSCDVFWPSLQGAYLP